MAYELYLKHGKLILNKSNQHVEITDEIKTQIINANEFCNCKVFNWF